MHYHDPDRPRSAGGLPQFLPPGWGILPTLEVRPTEDGYWEVSGWFMTVTNKSASRRTYLTGEIDRFLLAWEADPEDIATHRFGYSGPRAPEPLVVSGAPSLEDLDL